MTDKLKEAFQRWQDAIAEGDDYAISVARSDYMIVALDEPHASRHPKQALRDYSVSEREM